MGQGFRETGSSGLSTNDCIGRHLRGRSTPTSVSCGSRNNHSANDPAISETSREIRIEAATLLDARNDATREAAKAKEAAEMVASKKGLAKDPAALTAANQLFANCEDVRTRIQTRVAKFIQNPLMDY